MQLPSTSALARVAAAALVVFVFGAGAHAEEPTSAQPTPRRFAVRRAHVSDLLGLEANVGQAPPAVEFIARPQGYTAYLSAEGALLYSDAGERIRMRVGDAPSAGQAVDRLPHRVAYLKGRDAAAQRRSIPSFKSAVYATADGVDTHWRVRGGLLEFELHAAPGVDVAAVPLRLDGVTGVRVHARQIVADTPYGRVTLSTPVAWQETAIGRVERAARFVVPGDGTFRVDVAGADPTLPLVVDPTLSFLTYFGGTLGDIMQGDMAFDSAGRLIIAGHTGSSDFPVTTGAWDTSYGDPVMNNGNRNDTYVARLSSDGETLEWATYIGGAQHEECWGMAVGPADEVYVTGRTQSGDYPLIRAEYDELPFTSGGYLTMLRADGSDLVASTYLRSGDGHALAVDGAGRVHVGMDYIHTSFARYAAGIEKIDWTYQPTIGNDRIQSQSALRNPAIAVDERGNLFVGGTSPAGTDGQRRITATEGAFQTELGGSYMLSLDSDGELRWLSFFGGNVGGRILDLTLDAAGFPVVTGITGSDEFPTTAGAYQTTLAGSQEAFVARVAPNGSEVRWATYLGGSGYENATAIATHPCGIIYVLGTTNSTDFPILDALQSVKSVGYDAFVASFDVDGSLLYSSYLGGDSNEATGDLVVDADGALHVSGNTPSTDLPTTEDAYQTEPAGSNDIVLLKLSGNAPNGWRELLVNDELPDATRGQAYDATLGRTGGAGPFNWVVFDGDPPSGLTFSASGTLSGTPDADGEVRFGVDVTGTCGIDSAEIAIVVNAPPTLTGDLLPEWTKGVPISALIVPNDGTAPFAFDPPTASLPLGTSLSPAGRLTGAPTAVGRQTFDVTLTDRWGAQTAGTAVLLVNPSVAMTTTALPPCTAGSTYTFRPAATGGTGTLVWELRGGQLHVDAVAANGEFVGLVGSSGDYPFTLRVRDAVGGFVDRVFSVAVNPQPTIVTKTLPPAAVGRPYAGQLSVVDGTPAYAWTVGGAGLPEGLLLDGSTGELSGVATRGEVRAARFLCADESNVVAERSISVTVAPGAEIAAKGRSVENFEYVAAGDTAPTLRFVDLLEGSLLTATVKRLGKAKGPAPFDLELLDGSGAPIDVRAFLKAGKRAVSIKKFRAARTGRYFVRVTPDRESIGKLKLDVRATAPTKLFGEATLDPDGVPLELRFPALLGAKVSVVVKPGKKSAARPLLTAFTDAGGADLLATGKRKPAKGGDASRGALIGTGGDGLVRVVAAEGSGVGEIRWQISFKSKKGYALELLQ